jgi:four helix bundle protein
MSRRAVSRQQTRWEDEQESCQPSAFSDQPEEKDMSRDHRKLRIFSLADELVLEVYSMTSSFPNEEKYGLQSQLRRAAVSVPTNIVEGCARRTEREYAQFINIALASASEVRYLISLSHRLGLHDKPQLEHRYDELVRAIDGFIRVLDASL